MDPAERETVRLWRIHRTVHRMVADRGYIVSQSELDMSLSDFANTYGAGGVIVDRNALNFLVQKKNDPSDQMFVFFPEDASVGVKPIRMYSERMVDQGVFKAIIVIKQSISSAASKVFLALAPKYQLDSFFESELLVNITEHSLVPKHQLLSPDEKAELLAKYRLKETQLPRINQADPVARYYGLRKGDVVKIIRASETAGRYVTFRYVI